MQKLTQKSLSSEPLPLTFFEDVRTSELLYFLGTREHSNTTDYIFNTSAGQRILSGYAFESFIIPVNPRAKSYRFSSVQNSAFFDEIIGDLERAIKTAIVGTKILGEQGAKEFEKASKMPENPENPVYGKNPRKRTSRKFQGLPGCDLCPQAGACRNCFSEQDGRE